VHVERKGTMEENLDTLKKEKWHRYNQSTISMVYSWFGRLMFVHFLF